jgi:hypothetical protein
MREGIGEVVSAIYPLEIHPVSYTKKGLNYFPYYKVKSQVINLELKIDGTNCICNIRILFILIC